MAEEVKTQLSEEEIKKLVEEILKDPKKYSEEAKFILVLNEWSRPGPSFRDYGKIKVLDGEAEFVKLDNVYQYPTTNETRYAIIPRSRRVIILHESGNDYDGKMIEHASVYVFSYPTGWRKVKLY